MRHTTRFRWAAILVALLIIAGVTMSEAQDDGDQCLRLGADGEYEWFDCYNPPWLLPSSTPTNTPSPTASPTPTNTPTATPTLTPTPDVTIEPTIDVGTPVPTDTPGPTLPPPDPEKCYGTVQVQGLRLRAGPYIGAAILGAWNEGDRVWIHRVVYDEVNDQRTDEWGEVSAPDGGKAGWSAIWHDRTNYIVYDTTQACSDVRFPEPEVILDGLHLLVGAQQVVLNWLPHFGTLKGLTHSDQIPLMAKQLQPETVIVYRSLYNGHGQSDGPSADEWTNPAKYWDGLRPFLVGGFDYYEFVNEVGPPNRAVEADFNIAMLDLMAQDGYCGLAFSPGPGNPEIPAWDEWVRTLRWIDAHPCGTWPDGRVKYHGLAIHQAGKLPEWVPTLPDNYSKNVWIYGRIDAVDLYLKLTHGYDLHDFKGPIYVTEMGFEDYTIPNEQFTCEEVKAGVDATRTLYQTNGLVDGFQLWNFWGPDAFGWVDLTPCLSVIYE